MSVRYLFAGEDVSGRDLLLSRTPKRKLEGILARTVTAFAITAAAFVASPGGTVRAASTGSIPLDVSDRVLERVWKVRTEGVPPTDKARRYAAAAVEMLREAGIEPDRVVADPDGGVALYAFGRGDPAHAKHARILAANEGTLITFCVDHARNRRDVWEVELADFEPTVRKIQSFVLS